MIHTIFRDDELIVALNGIPYTIDVFDPRYEEIAEAIYDKDEEKLEMLLSIRGRASKMMDDLSNYDINEVGGDYTYKGNPVAFDLNDYLRSAVEDGNYMPVVNFIQRLYKNPNNDTRQRLFTFMEKNRMPIDDQGRFLAYKAVRSNYYDKHSGSVYNGVGTIVPKMEWDEVDTDPTNYCSRGYHACAKSYIDDFFYSEGDKVVAVAIAPEDVASIPDDYDGAKLRCRTYEVVSDITHTYETDKNMHLRSDKGLNPDSSSNWSSGPNNWGRDFY